MAASRLAETDVSVEHAFASAWEQLRARAPRDRFYAFGAWAGAGTEVVAVANTEQALRGAAAGARWHPPAWGLRAVVCRHGGPGVEPAERARRLAACARALRALDAEGRFGVGEERERLVVSVFTAGAAPEEVVAVARGLNPPAVVARLRDELRVAPDRFGEGEGAYAVHALAQADDGTVAVVADDLVLAWSSDGAPRLRSALPGAWSLALSPAGDLLVVGEGPGGAVRRFSLPDGRAAPELAGPPLGVAALALAGDQLLVAGHDDELLRLDAARGDLRQARRVRALHLAPAPPSDRVAVATGGRVLVLDLTTLATRAALGRRADALACAACSPDGTLLAAGGDASGRGVVVVFDASTGAERARFSTGDAVTCLAWSRDGTRVAAGDAGGVAWVWDARGLRARLRTPAQAHTGVAFTPDGATLVTAGRDVTRGPLVRRWPLA